MDEKYQLPAYTREELLELRRALTVYKEWAIQRAKETGHAADYRVKAEMATKRMDEIDELIY